MAASRVFLSSLFLGCVCSLLLAAAPVASEYAFVAFARLSPTIQSGQVFSEGWVRFEQISFTNKSVNVTVYVRGSFHDGSYAVIVHQYGDLTDKSAGTSLGGHFVGGGSATNHSCSPNPVRHEGDLGNWNAVGGVIKQSQIIPFDAAGFSLHDPHEIVGLGVALHANTDTCAGTDGDVGSVVAMGVVGIANVENNEAHCDSDSITSAVAVLQATSKCPACSGTVWFSQTLKGVLVEAQVFGLVQGSAHAISIRTFGDLSGDAEALVGTHLNPYGRMHALPPAIPRHMGDLGYIKDFSQITQSSWYRFETANIPNVRVIIGRAVVIDAQPDHGIGIGCDQQGSSGPAFALGVIGAASPSTSPPGLPAGMDPKPDWTNLNCTVPNGSEPSSGNGELVALVLGWVLAAVFLATAVGLVIYYYAKLRGRAGYESF